jgi:hypothetical protein
MPLALLDAIPLLDAPPDPAPPVPAAIEELLAAELAGPLPPHIMRLMQSAQEHPSRNLTHEPLLRQLSVQRGVPVQSAHTQSSSVAHSPLS